MNSPRLKRPSSPNFSCGPTKKPDGWSISKIDKTFLGRYHRSKDVKKFISKSILKLKNTLRIPNDYEVLIFPGSCTGAMEAVIWSLLGKKKVSVIIYDYWAQLWCEDLHKINLVLDVRKDLTGDLPNLKNISPTNDILFVWTGTSTGMSIKNLDFIKNNHKGLVISDITSAAFTVDIPWKVIDVSVFSWQKALGSESQHGVVVMSPKAKKRLKNKNIPKVLSISDHDFLINTPSILSFADLNLCLDLYKKNGGLVGAKKRCRENKLILDKWEKDNKFIQFFSKNYQSLTPSYFIFKKKINHKKIFNFLKKEKIAFDIENYRKAKTGIRIWNGPNIKKNDLIALTNWLDWCFKKF